MKGPLLGPGEAVCVTSRAVQTRGDILSTTQDGGPIYWIPPPGVYVL